MLTESLFYQFITFAGKTLLMKLNSRRTFLRIILIGIISFFAFVWNKLTLNHLEISKQGKRLYPFIKNKSVSFFDNIIVINQDEKVTVFSSHCTHLGCKINKVENGRFVCPCHGSEYDLQGKVIKGPAHKNLEIIPSKITNEGTTIEIGG